MGSTRVSQHIAATCSAVYRALLDPVAVATWRVPDGMISEVHEFDAREGGAFRVTLTYETPTTVGKTSAQTDTYHGRFVKLVANEKVVEVVAFESVDPELLGQMTITTSLVESDSGTEVSIEHEGIPPGVAVRDNEMGTRMALTRLAALVENSQSDLVRRAVEVAATDGLSPAETAIARPRSVRGPRSICERLDTRCAHSSFLTLSSLLPRRPNKATGPSC